MTVSDTAVSFTHNAVGDLPGIMQEAEISPLQRLPCHFVGQFVSERWRETEARRVRGQIQNLHQMNTEISTE